MSEPKPQTIEELAKELRQMAELTAKHSKNWDNFQGIALSMLREVYKVGREDGVLER